MAFGKGENVFFVLFIWSLIYIPRCYLPGQEFAPSLNLEGCQRVIEPDLSPLLYKSKPFKGN